MFGCFWCVRKNQRGRLLLRRRALRLARRAAGVLPTNCRPDRLPRSFLRLVAARCAAVSRDHARAGRYRTVPLRRMAGLPSEVVHFCRVHARRDRWAAVGGPRYPPLCFCKHVGNSFACDQALPISRANAVCKPVEKQIQHANYMAGGRAVLGGVLHPSG